MKSDSSFQLIICNKEAGVSVTDHKTRQVKKLVSKIDSKPEVLIINDEELEEMDKGDEDGAFQSCLANSDLRQDEGEEVGELEQINTSWKPPPPGEPEMVEEDDKKEEGRFLQNEMEVTE